MAKDIEKTNAQDRFIVNGQYIKDLSFENPNAPISFQDDGGQPDMDIRVDVTARKVGDNAYESVLKISASARRDKTVIFVTELAYAGIFTIEGVADDKIASVLLIDCPEILFPFARQIIADATQQGGYMPLMLQPIDFDKLYQQQGSQKDAGEKKSNAASEKARKVRENAA